MPNNEFAWIAFYTEFAEKLLPYVNDRKTLIAKIQAVFESIGMKLPTLERGDVWIDTDPFTVFGLFNKSLRDEERIAILQGIATEFAVTAPVPKSFEGIPLLNNQKATIYSFLGERQDQDIDTLWRVFVGALAYTKDSSRENELALIQAYDAALLQKGVKWNLSMGLFWIAPYSFINLDSRNRWFLSLPERFPQGVLEISEDTKEVPRGEQYLKISSACKEELEKGNYSYRNFPELSREAWIVSEWVNDEHRAEASAQESPVVEEGEERGTHYWVFSPGLEANLWDEFHREGIMAIGWDKLRDLRRYKQREDMRDAMKKWYDPSKDHKDNSLATWQFCKELKTGDIVYAKRGRSVIVGRGIVSSEYYFDLSRDEYKHCRRVKWTHCGEWPLGRKLAVKTLTDITPYEMPELKSIFEEGGEPTTVEESLDASTTPPLYTKSDFLNEVYMSEAQYDRIVGLLRYKRNVILQGAPGVGKTYSAKRLAYSMMGERDDARVEMVQFHQSTSYEDFVMGYRPTEGGFELKKGPFYAFCKRAEADSGRDYFFVIDEINRGNVSKIFGELFMLIESDKRGMSLPLLYSDEVFSVPQNVFLIGLMNTADRSLAMLDYALRRRFAFVELVPAFEAPGFRERMQEANLPLFAGVIRAIQRLNAAIESDDSLGRGFRIGHSYFCEPCEGFSEAWLRMVVECEIIPLLEEYWFDDPAKVDEWAGVLRGALE